MKYLFSVLIVFGLLACGTSNKETESINPTRSLNEVLACENLAGLEQKYGKESLIADTSWVVGDDRLSGTILYPNSTKQVYVYYRAGQIVDVTIVGNASEWKTNSGLLLGMPLKSVQAINQKNFTLSGFNWKHGGSVVSWEGGKLMGDNTLGHLASFSNASNKHEGISDEEYRQISGETEFDVRHEIIQKLNPSLDLISLVRPFIPNQEEGKNMGKRISDSQIPPVK
jgi:hypothetical protein